MQRVDLQFYAFFMTNLSGIALGFLFDLLRVLRGYYRPGRWVSALGDLLFWAAATGALAAGLFAGNWGEFRLYVLVGLLAGVGLYYWLASPVVIALLRGLLGLLTWLLELIWAPVVALAALLWKLCLLLWGWAVVLLGAIGSAATAAGGWFIRPLIRPYRLIRLHYLLMKRRVKRRLRRWLLGPRSPRDK